MPLEHLKIISHQPPPPLLGRKRVALSFEVESLYQLELFIIIKFHIHEIT